MLTRDYLHIINDIMASHAQSKQQQQQQQQQTAQKLQQQPGHMQQAASSSQQVSDCHSSSSTRDAGLLTTLQLFRERVVPACQELQLPRPQLMKLLRSASADPCNSHQQQHSSATAELPSDDDMQRHLLSVELICRDSRAADSYVFTVPGAAVFVRSVVSGRQELLQVLQRKR